MLPDMVINWDRLIWNDENDNPLYYLRAILFVSEMWYRLMFMEHIVPSRIDTFVTNFTSNIRFFQKKKKKKDKNLL